VERLHGALFFIAAEPPQQASARADPGQHAGHHVRQQWQAAHEIELLEDEADLGADPADVGADCAVFLNLATEDADAAGAAVPRDQPGNMPEQGRLAGPGRPDQGDHLARCHAKADPAEGLVPAEGFVQGFDFDGSEIGAVLGHAMLLDKRVPTDDGRYGRRPL
jgi:hypothetical protein